MATISEVLAACEKPLPWTTKEHESYVSEDDDEDPLEIVDANGWTVADNVTYYATQVPPAAQRAITRAVNAHDALVAALEESRVMLVHLHVYGSIIEQIDAAIALARA